MRGRASGIIRPVNTSELSPSTLDLRARFPLQAASRSTRALPESVRLTGDTREEPGTMSTRHDIRAVERTAGNACAAASLILGRLLLLIRPGGPAVHMRLGTRGNAINPKERRVDKTLRRAN